MPRLLTHSHLTYEEGVQLEAERRAARLVSKPWVSATAAGFCGAAVVMIAAESIFDVTRIYTLVLSGITFIALYWIVDGYEERYRRVVAEEWHKIDKDEVPPAP